MKSFSQVFIDHPKAAWVVSILIALCGAICLGRMAVAEYPNVTPVTITVTCSYTGAGTKDLRLVSRASCTTNWLPVLVTGPDGERTELSRRPDGLVSRIEADSLPPIDLAYDGLGNLSSVMQPGPGGESRVVSFTNNWRGRPRSASYPDGTIESFKYDGNGTKVVRHVDRLGRQDVYKWVLGLPVHAGRVIGGVTNTLFGVEHDRQLNVVSITDPLGRRAESYALDANDRVVAVTNLEGQVMTRSYAVGDLVASERRFDWSTVFYGHDSSGNVTSVRYWSETLSFAYDADGLCTSASNGAGLVTNCYDAATGWLDASRGADGTWVEYARSNGGSVTSMTSVAGTTAYSLDAAKRWTRLLTPSAAFDFGYCGWNGRLAAVTNSSGFVVQYAYDIMDRVTNISWRTTSGATIGGFAYEYDALGRITSRSHTLGTNAFDRVYTYDDFDRLASDGDVVYTYDAAGNRMTRVDDGETITYTLGIGDRLASWTGGAYTHDTAGNVTRIERDGRPTLDLTWNSQYQLVAVSTNGVFAESYTYDALSRRVSTTTLEGTTRHIYDKKWQVLADIDEQGNVVASYVWGEGIDRLLAVTIGGETYYPLADIQGTVWGYVDSQNNIVARWQYDAWGNVLDEEVSIPMLSRLRYRFQGREWSATTGLTNFRMRWYDAETGRWLSKDPIGLNGGLNLYAFCKNAPILYTDVLGLCDDESSWLDKFWDNYDDIDQDWSDFFHLDTSDSLGYIGISSAVVAMGTSALASIATAAAEFQINAGKLAGARCNGNIPQKIAAAAAGAKSAKRAMAGKMGLGLASKASGIVGAGATVWSISVRAGFAIAAAAMTAIDER